VIFIDIDFVFNVSNASNAVAFDRVDSIVATIIEEMLRNSILLSRRQMDFRRAHNAYVGGEGGKLKSNVYSFTTALIEYVQ